LDEQQRSPIAQPCAGEAACDRTSCGCHFLFVRPPLVPRPADPANYETTLHKERNISVKRGEAFLSNLIVKPGELFVNVAM
jgi:hypothetical protein